MKYIFLFLAFSLPVFSSVNTNHGTWFGLFHKGALSETYFLWTEAQLRYQLDEGGMQQTLFRTGGLKKLNDHHEIGLIYGFIQTGLLKEHRPTLQHAQRFGSFFNFLLTSRSRLEWRLLEDSTDEALRLRYMLRAQKTVLNDWELVLWDEPFINLTKDEWTGNRTVDRNRFFIGTRLPFLRIHSEVGYLNQYIPRKKDTMEHLLIVYLFY